MAAGSFVRELSLIMGRGGYKTGGGAHEVLPLQKGGSEKVSAKLKGGTTSFGVVLMRWHKVLAILKGGIKGFHSLKRGDGRKKVNPVLRAGCERFRTPNFPIL